MGLPVKNMGEELPAVMLEQDKCIVEQIDQIKKLEGQIKHLQIDQVADDKLIQELRADVKGLQEESGQAWVNGFDALENDIAEVLGLTDDNDTTPIVDHVARLARGHKRLDRQNERLRDQLKREKEQRTRWQDEYCKIVEIRNGFAYKLDMMTTDRDNAVARVKTLETTGSWDVGPSTKQLAQAKDLRERYKHQYNLANSRWEQIQALEKELKVLRKMTETTAYEADQGCKKLGIK